MKVFVIAALSADGFIARSSNEFPDWTSKEDKLEFVKLTKNSVLIFGGNTFRSIGKPLPNRKNIVYTRRNISIKGVETTQENPKRLINRLEKANTESVAICGGGSIYSMFLRSGLVTDLYLTYAPILFGTGIKFLDNTVNINLNLIDLKKLNENTLQMHYKIGK